MAKQAQTAGFGRRAAAIGDFGCYRGAKFGDTGVKFNTVEGEVTVNLADMTALRDAVAVRFAESRGFALATLNLDHLVKLRKDNAFARAYRAQDFVVADGNPVVWLSKLGDRPVTLLPGSELVGPLAEMAADAGVTLALVGSTEESLAAAADALMAQVSGLEVVCQIAPPMGFDPEGEAAADVLAEVASSGAGLAFLALGAPKQEILAARGLDIAPNVGFASVGAGLDFLSGAQRRAPKWVQAIAMEWLWRLLSRPSQLAMRYARCFAILPALVREARQLK
ncbi:exopolysaccharide biosynthesis WecB/TagA/CpsF family protein [Shimia isoporae]|uniref:Exopolysaccharide biosynthesis WecB/TagA/CpsF family protein n=1 Tax=Shimia isoporae TaxID=647720 RepID=A0A4R1N4T9_9RHOB|nr:WecB/TagA/CpsF family glycosyltransferase [Shimia isoporae]TCL00735.1 exopolysaccharide biosynthesis WecB/TagA/CpsF family protein [Shimia isoporae]